VTRLIRISLIFVFLQYLYLLSAIAQNSAVMLVQAKVVSSESVQWDMQNEMVMNSDTTLQSRVSFSSDDQEGPSIRIEDSVEVINEKGKVINLAVNLDKRKMDGKLVLSYRINGKVHPEAYKSGGLYRGSLRAEINYF